VHLTGSLLAPQVLRLEKVVSAFMVHPSRW
jgi:hypothetical protein